MLEHLVDFGVPIVPSIETLAKIVKKPTFTEKIKNTFKCILLTIQSIATKAPTEELEALVSSLENKSTLDAALMWKDTASKDSTNTFLFEVVERLECLLDNEGNIVDSKVIGTIYASCSITGSAEASLGFKTTFPMSDYCLHKDAVLANSTEQFKNVGILRFFPTGSCIELLRYTIENPPIALPFNLTYDLLAKPVFFLLNYPNRIT